MTIGFRVLHLRPLGQLSIDLTGLLYKTPLALSTSLGEEIKKNTCIVIAGGTAAQKQGTTPVAPCSFKIFHLVKKYLLQNRFAPHKFDIL